MHLFHLLTCWIEKLDESFKVHEVFKFVTHALSPSLGDYVFACFVFHCLESVVLQVVNIKDVEIVKKLVEFRKNRSENFYTWNACQKIKLFIFCVIELSSHL